MVAVGVVVDDVVICIPDVCNGTDTVAVVIGVGGVGVDADGDYVAVALVSDAVDGVVVVRVLSLLMMVLVDVVLAATLLPVMSLMASYPLVMLLLCLI